MKAEEVVTLARSRVGQLYVYGADVPLDDPLWAGPWDCAEFASWLAFQASGRLVGCLHNGIDVARAEPHSGAWAQDVRSELVQPCSIEEAIATPGAVLVRAPSAQIGHVAITNGTGGTIEAHSRRLGVAELPNAAHRRWTHAGRLRDVEYPGAAPEQVRAIEEAARAAPRILRRRSNGQSVLDVQRALRLLAQRTGLRGLHPGPPDGYFGANTHAAVYAYQMAAGLRADGEVGPETAAALGVTL